MNGEKVYARGLYTYLGCVLVLYAALSTELFSEGVSRWCSALCVPGIFLAVGLICTAKEAEPVRLAKGILIPWINFSLIRLVIEAIGMLLQGEGFTQNSLTDHILDTLSFFGPGELWIFPALLVALLIHEGLRRRLSIGYRLLVMLAVLAVYTLLSALYLDGLFELTRIVPTTGQIFLLQLSFLLWRGVLGAALMLWGELMNRYALSMQKKRGKLLFLAFLLLIGGSLAVIPKESFSIEMLTMGMPFCAGCAALGISGGAYLLLCWIGQVKPLTFLGKYAGIFYPALSAFFFAELAKEVGRVVFLRFDHRFVMRFTVAAVLTVLQLTAVYILRLPFFSFLFGGEDFSTALMEEEEEYH